MSAKRFTIVTYNFFRGGKSGERNQWPKLLKRFDPHIVLAQETRHLSESLSEMPDSIHWVRMNDTFGTGVLAIHAQVKHNEDFKSCYPYAIATITTPPPDWPAFIKWPLCIVSIHVADKLRSSYFNRAEQILDEIASLPRSGDLVIGGDFNLTVGIQHEDRDGLVTTKKERELLKIFKDDFGLMSAWQTANPNKELAQTLRISGDAKHYHCDGIFIPAAWYQHLEDCTVFDDSEWHTLSDHNPVVANFWYH